MTNNKPWTRKQLTTRMNKAGWYSIGHGVYEHEETARKIGLMNYKDGRVVWRAWAEAKEVPGAYDYGRILPGDAALDKGGDCL